MTDIVLRLRKGVYGTSRIALCEEAAVEIERLRSLLNLPSCGSCPGDGSICKESCRLAKESPEVP